MTPRSRTMPTSAATTNDTGSATTKYASNHSGHRARNTFCTTYVL